MVINGACKNTYFTCSRLKGTSHLRFGYIYIILFMIDLLRYFFICRLILLTQKRKPIIYELKTDCGKTQLITSFLAELLFCLFVCKMPLYVSKTSLYTDKNTRWQKWLQSAYISSVTFTRNREFPGVVSVTSNAFWWRQNEKRERKEKKEKRTTL